MASGGDIKATFKLFATKNNGAEATSKDITRWCTDAGVFGKTCNSNNLDIAFSKVKPKGKNTITVKELDALIAELAKKYKDDKKCDEAEAVTKIKEKMSNTQPKGHGTTKTSKTGNVGKMTDASQYTGSHKERFDADGKGKGIAGREELADNSGYVGNYKGEGSFDQK
ncbi:hypothetical protein NP493_5g08032 [Ridgeia piscesae]|uniref:Tubulin polymerization-promoting protein family member 3 n=1 Tax=Ridgeia piscesae TaxID=27915 RepID=A0AAD9PFG2_RIDPI|nr:hypothetical protein NP493_5g08032 [Ridgeia piscesae]